VWRELLLSGVGVLGLLGHRWSRGDELEVCFGVVNVAVEDSASLRSKGLVCIRGGQVSFDAVE